MGANVCAGREEQVKREGVVVCRRWQCQSSGFESRREKGRQPAMPANRVIMKQPRTAAPRTTYVYELPCPRGDHRGGSEEEGGCQPRPGGRRRR